MGAATDWQKEFIEAFKDEDVYLFNPRRPDWDSSWKQHKDNPQFRGQVHWELNGIDMASLVVFNFDVEGLSPITLLELGYVVGLETKSALVHCPEGYWRKGNVDLTIDWTGSVISVDSLEELIQTAKRRLKLNLL